MRFVRRGLPREVLAPDFQCGCSGVFLESGSHRRSFLLEGRLDGGTVYDGRVNTFMRLINWFQTLGFRILGAVVRGATAFLARVLRRGRFRPWRGGA